MTRPDIIKKILDRAEEMSILQSDRISLALDLEHAYDEFNLELEKLLEADNFNFTHDICGIQNHINRETGKMEDYFVPRFAKRER